ncbi:MAG: hypothetical protein Q9213_001516 [Squamulea squamosa]
MAKNPTLSPASLYKNTTSSHLLALPPEGFTLYIDNTPLAVSFSAYSHPISLPALRSTYEYILSVALPKGTRPITTSKHWTREATVNLYPFKTQGMNWEELAFAVSALERFARTQAQVGFRFDVLKDGVGTIALGTVSTGHGRANAL